MNRMYATAALDRSHGNGKVILAKVPRAHRNEIVELHAEAIELGSGIHIALCERALAGDRDAIAECSEIIDWRRKNLNAHD